MAVTSLQKAKNKTPADLLPALIADYPEFRFESGKQDHWSPETKTIIYSSKNTGSRTQYSILHELSHAILNHKTYQTDIELLKLEAAAWDLATQIGKKYNVNIDGKHIQSCLNTYRDWLHERSTCPECAAHGLQKNIKQYYCLNCQSTWGISGERFMRCYRSKNRSNK